MENNIKLLNEILELQSKGEISVINDNGLSYIKLSSINPENYDIILKELNRDKESLIKLAKESKNKRWINDLALVNMYEYLNDTVIEMNNKISKLNEEIHLLKSELDSSKNILSEVQNKENISIDNFETNKENIIDKPKLNNYKSHRMGDEHIQNISFLI